MWRLGYNVLMLSLFSRFSYSDIMYCSFYSLLLYFLFNNPFCYSCIFSSRFSYLMFYLYLFSAYLYCSGIISSYSPFTLFPITHYTMLTYSALLILFFIPITYFIINTVCFPSYPFTLHK